MFLYVLPVVTVLICGLSFLLLIRDREKNPTRDVEQIQNVEIYTKSMIAYSVLMVVLTVCISVFMGWKYSDKVSLSALKEIALMAAIWPIAYIDYKTYRIPNSFILYSLGIRALILPFELFFSDTNMVYVVASEAIAAVGLFIAGMLCAVCMKGSIGFGDIKLFIVIGLFLGMDGTWGAVFTSLLVSFVIAIFLLISKKKSRKDAIPFGPAILIGLYLSICLMEM